MLPLRNAWADKHGIRFRGCVGVTMRAAKTAARKPAGNPAETGKTSQGFTAEEKAAMRERAKELKAAAGKIEGEKAVLEKIAPMAEPDRTLAGRIHAVIKANAPSLTPRLWYGMPAYAKGGDIVCHFQDAAKFKMRYATLGFSDKANLDEGTLWPVAFALRTLTPANEAIIAALVKRAVSGG